MCICVPLSIQFPKLTFTYSISQLVTTGTQDQPFAHKSSYCVHAALVSPTGVCVCHTLVHICKTQAQHYFPELQNITSSSSHTARDIMDSYNHKIREWRSWSWWKSKQVRQKCKKKKRLCVSVSCGTFCFSFFSASAVVNCQDLRLARYIKGNNSGLCWKKTPAKQDWKASMAQREEKIITWSLDNGWFTGQEKDSICHVIARVNNFRRPSGNVCAFSCMATLGQKRKEHKVPYLFHTTAANITEETTDFNFGKFFL